MTLLDYQELAALLGLGTGLWAVCGWGIALIVVSAIILAVSLTSRFRLSRSRTSDRQGVNHQDSS